MAYNQDAVVTSSQDEIFEVQPSSSSIAELTKGKGERVRPQVAKVFPLMRKKEKEVLKSLEKGDVEEPKLKQVKKQAFLWLQKFNVLCREIVGTNSYKQLDYVMSVYWKNVSQDVKNCYKKPNRAAKLKVRMNAQMSFFYSIYRNIGSEIYSLVDAPMEHNNYLGRMSDLLSLYLDMEIKSSRRGKENPKHIAARCTSALFVFLENSISHILTSILKANFFVKSFREVCIPIIMRAVRDVPTEYNDVTYVAYILVFKKWKTLVSRKEERVEINQMAASKLVPPPGFVDNYHDTDKYSGLLPFVAKGKKDKFTLAMMQAQGFNTDSFTEDYMSIPEVESELENPQQFEKLRQSLPKEEFYFIQGEDQPLIEKSFTTTIQQVWQELGKSKEDYPFDELFEDEFSYNLQKLVVAERKKRLEKLGRKTPKVKKISESDNRTAQPGVGCMHNAVKLRSPDCFGISTGVPNALAMKKGTIGVSVDNSTINEIRMSAREIPKVEADSPSQEEVFIDRVISVKEEPDIKIEEPETLRRDSVQTTVLRAVVRPENIEQLSLIEKDLQEKNQNSPLLDEELADSVDRIPEVTLVDAQEAQKDQEQDYELVPEEQEDDVVPSLAASVVDGNHSPLDELIPYQAICEEMANTTDVVPTNLVSQKIMYDFDPSNNFNQSLNDNFESYLEGIDDGQQLYSQDYLFGQDELMSQFNYMGGNCNFFPDFYNQDILIAGTDRLLSSLINPVEDAYDNQQSTTYHESEYLTMMPDSNDSNQQGAVVSNQEEECTPSSQEEVTNVVDMPERRRKSKKRGRKPKEQESGQTIEKNNIDTYLEEVNKKAKQAQALQRRRRVAFYGEDEDDEEEVASEPEPEPEPEPPTKRKRGRQKKVTPPAQSRPASPPPSPPPANSKKSRKGSQKKAQSKRR